MGISLPKPLKTTILGDFHENDMKWVEFGEKGSPIVKIPLKYALYSKAWRLVHAKHPFQVISHGNHAFLVNVMKSTSNVYFRGLGRKMPISGGKWWNYYQFGTVIACPNAMAAPGTILH